MKRLVSLGFLVLAVACQPTTTATPSPSTTPRPVVTKGPVRAPVPSKVQHPGVVPAYGSALLLVKTLTVKGRGPMTGYSRLQFGPAWQDTDHNGCDTRNDILSRDLTAKTYRNSCVVLSGTLKEPYTGQVLHWTKSHAATVQIDHVVALGDAWQMGAARWPYAKRLALANDPLELLAVDGPTNESKGDADTASWLPPNKSFRCSYVARQVAVKAKYALAVTAAERAAMVRVLSSCPTLPAPHGGNPTLAPGAAPSVKAQAVTPVTTSGHLDPRFASCKQAKAAGYGPYVKGKDPEYGWYRDGDHDGTDCE